MSASAKETIKKLIQKYGRVKIVKDLFILVRKNKNFLLKVIGVVISFATLLVIWNIGVTQNQINRELLELNYTPSI